MSNEVEIAYLKNFPTDLFKQMVEKWQKTSYDLYPEKLLSHENRVKTIEIVHSLSDARLKKLQKLAEMLNISNIWWKIYQITKIQPISKLENRKKTFDVQKYIKKNQDKIKGKITTIELSEHAIFIFVEFLSRRASLRQVFRYIYFPTAKKILIEEKNLSLEILNTEILPFITKNPEDIVEKQIIARTIKNLTKKSDNSEDILILTDLSIKVSLETSGIDGLNQITIQGNDVLRGVETLEQRHEISLKFMNSGPWIGGGTKDFKLEVGKGIQIRKLENRSLKNISTVLNWC